MIECKLSRMAGDRRVTKQQLIDATGRSRPTIAGLWNDTAKSIDLRTLDSLCRFLDCEPGELLEYHPDKDTS
jgi:putative transcriptional regulator